MSSIKIRTGAGEWQEVTSLQPTFSWSALTDAEKQEIAALIAQSAPEEIVRKSGAAVDGTDTADIVYDTTATGSDAIYFKL